jgi:hypothetical protein
MSPHLYRAVSPPGTNVSSSHLYQSEPPPKTNVRHLYLVGLEEAPTRPCDLRGHLYRAAPPTGTNVVICTRAKNTWYKSKNSLRIYVRFSSSAIVIYVRFTWYMCDSLDSPMDRVLGGKHPCNSSALGSLLPPHHKICWSFALPFLRMPRSMELLASFSLRILLACVVT